MDKESILIRLLKEGSISEEEFKLLYPKENVISIPWNKTEDILNPEPLEYFPYDFIHLVNPNWLPTYQGPDFDFKVTCDHSKIKLTWA